MTFVLPMPISSPNLIPIFPESLFPFLPFPFSLPAITTQDTHESLEMCIYCHAFKTTIAQLHHSLSLLFIIIYHQLVNYQ